VVWNIRLLRKKRDGGHIRGLKSGHVLLVSTRQHFPTPQFHAPNERTEQKNCDTKQKFARSLAVCPQMSISVFTLREAYYLRFELFTAVTMKNAVLWDVTRRVALVRTDVSEELSASIIRLTRIGELGTTLAVTSNRRTLRRNTYAEWCLLGCYTVWLL
jgi:hypothetical protein